MQNLDCKLGKQFLLPFCYIANFIFARHSGVPCRGLTVWSSIILWVNSYIPWIQASCSGVLFWLLISLGLAPFFNNSINIWSNPLYAVSCNGVCPPALTVFTFAPDAISNFTVSKLPWRHATCNGDHGRLGPGTKLKDHYLLTAFHLDWIFSVRSTHWNLLNFHFETSRLNNKG